MRKVLGQLLCALILFTLPVGAKVIKLTDVSGREVSINVPVKKVIIAWSGSGGPFMTMSALLGKDVHKHIAGWDSGLANYRKDMYDAYLKSVPELANLSVIGSPDEDDFNIEKVLTLAPDAAIFPLGLKATLEAGLQKKLESAGIPVFYTDYHAETIENHAKTTLLLGALFGKEDRAKKLTDLYVSKRQDIQKRVDKARKANKKPPSIYVEVGINGPSTYGNTYASGLMWGGILEIAGGINVAATAVAKWAPIAPEFLLQSDPDVIVLTGSFWPKNPESLLMGYTATDAKVQEQLTAFSKRPGWDNLKAIKNKRLFAVHHGIGRELFDFVSIEAFGKFAYPEEFKDVDPMADLAAYYRDFLPYELSGVWFTNWK